MDDIIVFTIMIYIFLMIIPLCYVMFNPVRKTKFLRMMKKKNYGIVNFVTPSGGIFPKIMDFGGDILSTKNGMWFIQGSYVYRQVDQPNSSKETAKELTEEEKLGGFKLFKGKKWKLHTNIDEKLFGHQEGIPVVNFDYNDMLPKPFGTQPYDPEQASRNAQHVKATVDKVIEAFKLEVLRSKWDKLDKILKVILILAALGGIMGFVNFMNGGGNEAWFRYLNQTIVSNCHSNVIVGG